MAHKQFNPSPAHFSIPLKSKDLRQGGAERNQPRQYDGLCDTQSIVREIERLQLIGPQRLDRNIAKVHHGAAAQDCCRKPLRPLTDNMIHSSVNGRQGCTDANDVSDCIDSFSSVCAMLSPTRIEKHSTDPVI
eukprot:4584571-Prymnesium_polylepis.2